MVVALMALFIALGGSSYAALKVGSKQIVNNSVRSKDIRNNDVRSTDVRNRSLLKKDFKPGQLPAGPQGPPGPSNLSGLTTVEGPTTFVAPGDADGSIAFCPGGSRAVSGGGSVISDAADGMAASRANDARNAWFVVAGNNGGTTEEVQA